VAPKVAEDPWLADRLGQPAFTVECGDGVPATDQLAAHAAENAPAFYQSRVPAESPEAAAALTAAGFAVVNVTVTLGRKPAPPPDAPGGFEVRPASAEADGGVLDIAERGFTKTRFHLDPLIPAEVANRIKRDWAENSLTGGRGDGMIVAVRDGVPVGFIATLAAETDAGRSRVIDLIAVDEQARGAGAGRALVASLLASADDEFDDVRVGTQAANSAATRFYERLGFTTLSSAYDLHLHAGEGRE
jgi:ribosomal protein S18 acetylase RimI-like enzyme